MQIKLAALVFPNVFPFPKLTEPFQFDANTFIVAGSFTNFLEQEKNQHWKDWLGELFWEDITGKGSLICISWQEYKAEAGAQTLELKTHINNLYHSLLLTGPWKNDGKSAQLLCGDGNLIEGRFTFTNINDVSDVNLWRHSGYYEVASMWDWQSKLLYDPAILTAWRDNFLAIEAFYNGNHKSIISLGLLALWNGLHSGLFDFRIPDFVRAIETIVALPKRKGAREFAKRTKRLLPKDLVWPLGITKDNIGSILREVYQIRSDCVHGKPFADTLKSKLGSEFESEIYKYEFAVEMSARLVIKNAISNKQLIENSQTRDGLEKVWKQLKALT